jgi:hypothetical protein
MMNQEDLFKKLGLILNELNEQYQFLAENPQQLSELELELFQANANFLADHVQIIKKFNLNQQAPLVLATADEEPFGTTDTTSFEQDDVQEQSQVEELTFAQTDEIEEETTSFKPEIEEQPSPEIAEIEEEVFKLDQEPSTFEFILNDHAEHETIDENPSKADEKFEFEEKSVDELFNRPLSEEEERILTQKMKLRKQQQDDLPEEEEDEIGPEPFLVESKEKFPIEKEDLELEAAPIEETQINPAAPVEDPTYKPTLNDLLAKKTPESINSTTGISITDLKQAINLNDKLLYIQDLFNGYNLAYAEAIDFANKLPNFEAADNFFKKNYAIKNNWAEKQATVDKFYQLLNQRFKR